MKNILFISSQKNYDQAFCATVRSLGEEHRIFLLGNLGNLYDLFKEKNYWTKNIKMMPDILAAGKIKLWFFFLLLPLQKLFYVFYLFYLTKKFKLDAVFLLGPAEKISLSPILRILKINCIWLEERYVLYNRLSKKVRQRIAKESPRNKILALAGIFRRNIEQCGANPDNVFISIPGIEIKNHKYQENIFAKIAQSGNSQVGKKFFTIGTISELNDKEKIETLFSAVKEASRIIPRVQLILVGGGDYFPDKNPWAKWLAKKMEIDNMVWFISDNKNIKKWLDSFDVFVISSRILNLDDLRTSLYAMEAGLPPLLPDECGYEDILENGRTGFFYNPDKPEALSDIIINYYKNRRSLVKISQAARQRAKNDFKIEHTKQLINKIL